MKAGTDSFRGGFEGNSGSFVRAQARWVAWRSPVERREPRSPLLGRLRRLGPEELSRESNGALSEPIEVKVVLMGELKRWAGKEDADVELQPGSTVQTLVAKLPELCGEEFAHKVLSKQGFLQPHIAVFINGIQMARLDGTKTVLTGGRVELMLLPVYEGG
jgi:molybdopterin converting factor small subunit